MKKLTFWVTTVALLIALNPATLKAERIIETERTKLEKIHSNETSRALIAIPEAEMAMAGSAQATETTNEKALPDRLNEIKEMEMSAMSISEKDELRNEILQQKEQRTSRGLYISVGTALLIVLVLILIL
jgi:hypothetical protein